MEEYFGWVSAPCSNIGGLVTLILLFLLQYCIFKEIFMEIYTKICLMIVCVCMFVCVQGVDESRLNLVEDMKQFCSTPFLTSYQKIMPQLQDTVKIQVRNTTTQHYVECSKTLMAFYMLYTLPNEIGRCFTHLIRY